MYPKGSTEGYTFQIIRKAGEKTIIYLNLVKRQEIDQF